MEASGTKGKIALLIPWFGRELKGGAEQQAWQIAARLVQRGYEVDVLTTCCRSHQDDWSTNHLPAGRTHEAEGFSTNRFRVDPRDRVNFDRACEKLTSLSPSELKPGVAPVSTAESRIFTQELIKSTELLTYLRANKEAHRWFICLPYLYGPILDAVAIVGERAALQPCLHDEAYAYLPEVAAAFHTAGQLLFNSEGELELAVRLFGPAIWEKATVVGEGVETQLKPPSVADHQVRNAAQEQPYLLYLGRREEGKNVPMLVRAFRRFRSTRPNSTLQLVLAGHGALENANDANVIDLGVISEERKDELLRSCVALLQPSRNESFSRAIMEAWLAGRPVVAQSSCLATSIPVRRSGGGWTAETEEEWAEQFTRLDRATAAALSVAGLKGQEYARKIADWDKVMDRYEQVLLAPKPAVEVQEVRGAIHQVLPNLSYGDAISNEAIFIRDTLRARGFASEIYVRYIDPRVAPECTLFAPGIIAPKTPIIYHHSIGTELTLHVVAHRGAKALIYHNITPAEYFDPFWPERADVLRRGRADLGSLARSFPISLGDSSFNVRELIASGFEKPGVLPLAVDPAKWSGAPDEKLMSSLQDGRTNILFVGRIAPNKKQDELVTAFAAYLDFDPTARLILAGKAEPDDPYATHLQQTIDALGLRKNVILPGSITDTALHAYWRTAHLFWSMSEHEGFCVPLVEAMWFDVPVLAMSGSAVPETLGNAGVMFTDKNNLTELAALAWLLVSDPTLRDKVIRAQRERRVRFLPGAVTPQIDALVELLLAS